MVKEYLPTIKWICTAFMFCGAIITSLQLHPWLNFVFLSAGNGAWAIILLRMREYAAASVFVIMCTTWSIGLVNYIIRII